MASNRKQRTPSLSRDPITGEPLQRSTLKLKVSDRDKRRLAEYQTPIPFRLHRRAEETVDRSEGDAGTLSERLGSHAYAFEFARYLDDGMRSERKKAREWWNMPYVLDRLAVHAQSSTATFSLDEMNIAVAWYKGYDLSDNGRSHYWVERARARVARYVRNNFLPQEERLAA